MHNVEPRVRSRSPHAPRWRWRIGAAVLKLEPHSSASSVAGLGCQTTSDPEVRSHDENHDESKYLNAVMTCGPTTETSFLNVLSRFLKTTHDSGGKHIESNSNAVDDVE